MSSKGKMVSTGYYYDLPKVGRAQLSRKYYAEGGSGLGLASIFAGRTVEELVALIGVLFIYMTQRGQTRVRTIQRGGVAGLMTALSASPRESLITMALILLLGYYWKEGSRGMRGGGKGCGCQGGLTRVRDMGRAMNRAEKREYQSLVERVIQQLNNSRGQSGGHTDYLFPEVNFIQPPEVAGEAPLNYTKNLQQFGCLIPEWGTNLKVCSGYQTNCL